MHSFFIFILFFLFSSSTAFSNAMERTIVFKYACFYSADDIRNGTHLQYDKEHIYPLGYYQKVTVFKHRLSSLQENFSCPNLIYTLDEFVQSYQQFY